MEVDRDRRGWAPAAAAGAVALVSASVAWPFTCDDAAITFRFAEQAAAGNPLGTVAAGDPVVSGFSNPTWTALLTGAARLGLPVTGTAKVLGALCFALTAVLATRLILRLVDRAALAWIGVAVGASSTLAIWSVSGLENPLVGLLVTAAALLLVREEQQGLTGWRSLGSSAAVAALVVSRPDAFTYLAAAALARVLATRRRTAGGGVRIVAADLGRWLVAPVAVLVGWTAFSVVRFGHPLANTVYAKVGATLGDRAVHLVDPASGTLRATLDFALITAAVLVIPLAAVGAWPRRTATTTVTILSLASLILPISETDWMADFRFYAACVPLLVVLAAAGVDVLVRRSEARAVDRSPATSPLLTPLRLGVGLVVLWAFFNATLTFQRADEDFASQVTVESVREATEPIAAAGDGWALDDPLVMTADAGATVDDLDLRILDLAGLLDPQVAHLMDDPDGRREYAFAERRPELVRAGYASWSWNGMWDLTPAAMESLGYLRLPQIDEPAYLRRDLVVRPAAAGAPEEVALDALTAPRATSGGQVTVRAWITAPADQRDGQIQIRLRRAAPDEGSPGATATVELGSGLLAADGWDEDEAVLHLAQLAPPAGDGDLVVEVRSLAPDGETTVLGEQPVAWGAAAVRTEADEIGVGDPDDPEAAVAAVQQLRDLAAAAPAQQDETGDRIQQVRADGLAALHDQLDRELRRGSPASDMETARRAIVAVRGRTGPDARWAALADRFQARAASAGPQERYRLLVVAASADPSDPSIQKDLLAARAARPSRLTSTPAP